MNSPLQDAIEAIVGIDGLEQRLQAAMGAVRHHWVVTSEEEQFKAAISAVLLSYSEGSDEWKQLTWEVQQLGTIGGGEPIAGEPIGLLRLWCSAGVERE